MTTTRTKIYEQNKRKIRIPKGHVRGGQSSGFMTCSNGHNENRLHQFTGQDRLNKLSPWWEVLYGIIATPHPNAHVLEDVNGNQSINHRVPLTVKSWKCSTVDSLVYFSYKFYFDNNIDIWPWIKPWWFLNAILYNNMLIPNKPQAQPKDFTLVGQNTSTARGRMPRDVAIKTLVHEWGLRPYLHGAEDLTLIGGKWPLP